MIIQPGTDIGRYHILEQLGEGGMAVVYKAYDTRLEAEVAVKIIRTENILPKALERTIKRFKIEARKMAQLNHPNIVRVLDFGDFEGYPYLVMPYLPGGTLKDLLGKPMDVDEAVSYLLPIAHALGYAHKQGLIHRDVKPSNILLTDTREPILSDFGVAKVLEAEETLDLTTTGMGVGTPDYMAPEQASGKSIDERVDMYALGIVLYELLTGRRPFIADTPMAVVIKQITEALPAPSTYNKHIPENAEKLLYKTLAKDPSHRYSNMDSFANALKKLVTIRSNLERNTPHDQQQEEINWVKEKRKLKNHFTQDTHWVYGFAGVLGLGLMIFAGIHLFGKNNPSRKVDQQPTFEIQIDTATPAIPTSTQVPTQTPVPTKTSLEVLNPEIGSKQISNTDGMTMVYVPEGFFYMGSNRGDDDEQPVHSVFLDAFWIDQTEVTNSQYSDCVNAEICNYPSNPLYFNDANLADHPVVNVDWFDANIYCEWAGRKLPTEAQWEKAARGSDRRPFPWGEEINCNRANHWGCGEFSQTSPVGYYGESGASPYGAYAMAGNAWEWVADWYQSDYYQNSPENNPVGPNSGTYRILRGGSWDSNVGISGFANSTYRYEYRPDITYREIGFRCAVDAE